MSRKSKIDPALKVELVERYLEGEISAKEAGRLAGLAGNGADTFHKWVNIYRNEGPVVMRDQQACWHKAITGTILKKPNYRLSMIILTERDLRWL